MTNRSQLLISAELNLSSFHELKQGIKYIMSYTDCKALTGNIDDYFENWKKLGDGSYGEVYNAMPTAKAKSDIGDLPDEVAIKLFVGRVDRHALKREIRLLKLITVPRGIKYYGCYENVYNHRVYIITSIAPGHDLQHLLTETDVSLSLKHKNAIVQELSKGIAELHSIYIIHRDLKPDNIIVNLLPDTVDLHIIDYGLSCYMHDGCFTRGAPIYRDPKESRESDKKLSDWYAFGLVCIYIYTGVHLWYYPTTWSPDPEYHPLNTNAKDKIPIKYRSILLKLTDNKLEQSERPTPAEIIDTFS
jgi:serine/threonine protein kinase